MYRLTQAQEHEPLPSVFAVATSKELTKTKVSCRAKKHKVVQ